jgi:LAO/AO transport system kinase
LQEIAPRILNRDARALGRAATWIENRRPEAEALLRELLPKSGRALVLGVTGAPGSGKSTLCGGLARELRAQGKTVAIVAVDPTSPYTGGALLGDRIRMQQHHEDPGVFIRSMATRGSLGGLARATGEMTQLFDAAGFDVVIVETVGVGQDEVEIARLAEVTLVVLTPGTGDDVQAIKAGIMEIADVFVINKADLPGAEKLERELTASLALAHGHGGWNPVIVRTIASEGHGIGELLRAAEEHRARAGDSLRRRRSLLRGEAGIEHLGIDHLGIAVRSIEQALGFYRDQLGLSLAARETVEKEKVRVAMLPLEGSRIELLEPTEADSPVGKFLDKRGEGLHHVALKVPDLNAAVERLRAAGARLLNEPRAGAGGHLYVFVHPASTGGVLLELIQA